MISTIRDKIFTPLTKDSEPELKLAVQTYTEYLRIQALDMLKRRLDARKTPELEPTYTKTLERKITDLKNDLNGLLGVALQDGWDIKRYLDASEHTSRNVLFGRNYNLDALPTLTNKELRGIGKVITAYKAALQPEIDRFIEGIAYAIKDGITFKQVPDLGKTLQLKGFKSVVKEYTQKSYELAQAKVKKDVRRLLRRLELPLEIKERISQTVIGKEGDKYFRTDASVWNLPTIEGSWLPGAKKNLLQVLKKIPNEAFDYVTKIEGDLSYSVGAVADFNPATGVIHIPRGLMEMDEQHFKFAAAHEVGHAYNLKLVKGYWAELDPRQAERFADEYAGKYYSMPKDWETHKYIYTSPKYPESVIYPDVLADNLAKGTSEQILSAAKNIVTEGLLKNKSLEQISRDIMTLKNMSSARALRIARTEASRIANESVLKLYKNSQVIEKVDLVLDGNPCSICEDLALNNPYNFEEAQGMLPVHPNCMCAWLPQGYKMEDEPPQPEQPSGGSGAIESAAIAGAVAIGSALSKLAPNKGREKPKSKSRRINEEEEEE